MPLALAEIVWSQEGLGAPVLVDWGKLIGTRPDLVAAAGNNVFLFTPADSGYISGATTEVGAAVLSMAVGLEFMTSDNIILGLEDRLVVYGIRRGSIVILWTTDPEPGARFVDLALADIDGDGKEEVIAASQGKEALYIYRQAGEMPAELRLELLAIRILPGPAQKVTVIERGQGQVPFIVAAYKNNGSSGLLTLYFTERGFGEGPALENLPAQVTSVAKGDLTEKPGEEFAWGGEDGSLRVVEINEQINTIVTSENLGTTIPALTAGKLVGESSDTLIAGTPGGFIFGFRTPIVKSRPDWAVSTGKPVNDLAVSNEEGLLGLGATDGGVQVWLLSSQGNVIHTVQPGETLSSIAVIYKTTVAAIVKVNRIDKPERIFPGQKLLIP